MALLCVVMALSSSSRAPDFFNFLTRLLTAFSAHLSSCCWAEGSGCPVGDVVLTFQPSSRFTTGGVNASMLPSPLHVIAYDQSNFILEININNMIYSILEETELDYKIIKLSNASSLCFR